MRDSEHVSVDQTNLDPLTKSASDQIHEILKNYAPAPPDKVPPPAAPVAPVQAPVPVIVPNQHVTAPQVPVNVNADWINQPDSIAVIGPKTPTAAYIRDRVTLAAGRSAAQIMHMQYKDSNGYFKAYTKTDLKYDVNHQFLNMVTSPV